MGTFDVSLSCEGCAYFDGTCNHYTSEEQNIAKSKLVDLMNSKVDYFSTNWAKNIDKYYICLEYEIKHN